MLLPYFQFCKLELPDRKADIELHFIKRVSLKLTEYQLARPSDANRKEMLFGSLARPGHPMGKFFWGKMPNTYFIFSS